MARPGGRPPSQPPTIAFVGRIEEQKGPSVAYRAVAALRDRHGIDAQLKLAGRGSPAKLLLLERLAKELRIEQRVELLGHLDRAGVWSLLAGSSALLVPSTWQEPFGLVLIEAALAGCPWSARAAAPCPRPWRRKPLPSSSQSATPLPAPTPSSSPTPPETEARATRAFERATQLSSDGYARQAGEFLSAAVATHESHRKEHRDNEAARGGGDAPGPLTQG